MEKQAADIGDVRFFELAYLEAEAETKSLQARLILTDFVIPNTDLIAEDVRAKIKKWSDYVDYWAVDWDFQDDTFVNQWSSYRNRQDRALILKTEWHTYAAPGTYRALVKVIDIFGIDTSQVVAITVTGESKGKNKGK